MSDLIQITILYFASVKDVTGMRMETMELSHDISIEKLLKKISLNYPRLKSMLDIIQVAVNYKIVHKNITLKDGDEVALLPPVSGG